MNLKELKEKKITDLAAIAKELGVEGAAGMRKQDLIFAILNTTSAKNGAIFGEGVLEILPELLWRLLILKSVTVAFN